MKLRLLFFIVIFLIYLPVTGFAVETYNSLYFEGSAPITVDGDVSDWSGLNLEKPQLLWDSVNSPEQPANDDDFSATFQCCADAKYVYVAVDVLDDSPVFGEEKLGKAFWDDSVLIHFPNPWHDNSRLSISISLDEKGKEKVEYYEGSPGVDVRLPYIWQKLGVRVSLKKHEGGYCVEAAIPHRALGFNGSAAAMNVEVFDDDNGEDHESAILLDYKGWWHPDWYYTKVVFDRVSNQQVTEPAKEHSGEGLELEVVIEPPEQTSNKDLLYSILQNISYKNWVNAEEKLKVVGDAPWVKTMLTWIQYNGVNTNAKITTLSQLSEESTDEYVSLWAKDLLGSIYMTMQDYNSALIIWEKLFSSSNCDFFSLLTLVR